MLMHVSFWVAKLSILRGVWPEYLKRRFVLYRKKHPIYLLGGFGGASAQIVKLMKGETTAEKLFEEAKTNEDYKN